MTSTLTDTLRRALLHSVAEWTATFESHQQTSVSWNLNWMYFPLRGCGGWNNTSWRCFTAILPNCTQICDDPTPGWTLGAPICKPSRWWWRRLLYVSCVCTQMNGNRTLLTEFLCYFFVFFENFRRTQSLTDTEVDAMMYVHTAHQNTSVKIRALY